MSWQAVQKAAPAPPQVQSLEGFESLTFRREVVELGSYSRFLRPFREASMQPKPAAEKAEPIGSDEESHGGMLEANEVWFQDVSGVASH